MKKSYKILATRVGQYVNNSVRRLTVGLGISISEYLRRLIIQDLDSRSLFDDDLKIAVESVDEEAIQPRKRGVRFEYEELD